MVEWFYRFGVPARIHSDQGCNFKSVLIQQLCGLYNIEAYRTTLYHPAGNGQCERFNRTPPTCCATWVPAFHRYSIVLTLLPIRPLVSHPFSWRSARNPGDQLISCWVEFNSLLADVDEWIQEHQTQLWIASGGAREQLKTEKKNHDSMFTMHHWRSISWYCCVISMAEDIIKSKISGALWHSKSWMHLRRVDRYR